MKTIHFKFVLGVFLLIGLNKTTAQTNLITFFNNLSCDVTVQLETVTTGCHYSSGPSINISANSSSVYTIPPGSQIIDACEWVLDIGGTTLSPTDQTATHTGAVCHIVTLSGTLNGAPAGCTTGGTFSISYIAGTPHTWTIW